MTEHTLVQLSPDPDAPFPPTHMALGNPNGLLAWGGDLEPARLLRAYRQGIFPWYIEGQPILWWSPAPRCILIPANIYLSRRTRRRYNQKFFRLTADTAFEQVMRNCATRGQSNRPLPDDEDESSFEWEFPSSDTWITAEMIKGYSGLHQMGHAHSLEVWFGDKLVGGIYGIAIGAVFFGESMFSSKTDASKIALVALCRQLQRWSFTLVDCQVGNQHLFSMGAIEVAREEFESELDQGVQQDAATMGGSRWTDVFQCDNRW